MAVFVLDIYASLRELTGVPPENKKQDRRTAWRPLYETITGFPADG